MRVEWIKFKVRNWREGTDQLSIIEYGLYHKILVPIWEENKPIHESSIPNLCAGISKGEAVEALRRLVTLGKVKIDDDGRCWNQPAIDAHSQAAERIEHARRAGHQSGQARLTKRQYAKPGKAVIPQELPLDDPPPLVQDRPKYPIIETDRLKMIYPRNDRGAGSQRWMSVQRELMDRIAENGDTFEQILEGTKRYAAYAEAAGLVGTSNIYSVMTFYGKDRLYMAEWTPPKKKLSRAEQVRELNEQHKNAMLQKFGGTGA